MNLNPPSGNGKQFFTRIEWIGGVHFIFASVDRPLLGDECNDLAEKYFETHKRMTLPGQALLVDLRPAFREPLVSVLPQFCVVSKEIIDQHVVTRAPRSRSGSR